MGAIVLTVVLRRMGGDFFRLRALLRVAPGPQGHAKFSRTFAPDLCIKKAQPDQWPARVADVLRFADRSQLPRFCPAVAPPGMQS